MFEWVREGILIKKSGNQIHPLSLPPGHSNEISLRWCRRKSSHVYYAFYIYKDGDIGSTFSHAE